MKVLVVLGDGGHTADTLRLVELLGPKYEYSYLMSDSDQISEGKIKFPGPAILLRARPRAILNGAAGIGVPISILGRLLGVKVIYLENASRVYTLSRSGRILYHIVHLFFVQWESLKEKHPKAIYAGRLI